MSRVWPVVSTHWLRRELTSQVKNKFLNGGGVRVLDVSFMPTNTVDQKREHYNQGHISESVFYDMWNSVTSTPEIPRNLPEITGFTEYIRDMGIWKNTHVVAYDRFGPITAYRTWWLFRLYGHRNVSVLDGGLPKWRQDGYDLTTDVPNIQRLVTVHISSIPEERDKRSDVILSTIRVIDKLARALSRLDSIEYRRVSYKQRAASVLKQRSDFTAQFDKSLLRDHAAMVANIETKQCQVVDARHLDVMAAEEKGTGQQQGYIPGTKIVDFRALFNESDGTIKSNDELQNMFNDAGVDIGKPVITTCLLGMRACALAAALEMLGKQDIPVYYGSWTEWRQKSEDNMKVLLNIP